ncbi:MAG: hypothetical protein U0800_16785 [Isosphaeraceae bacterium]
MPPVPLITLGVGALVAIALLARAKEDGNWAIGGSLAGAVLLGSSLLGRLAIWAARSREIRLAQEDERLQAMGRIAEHLGRIVEHLHDTPLEFEPESPPSTAAGPGPAESPPLPVVPVVDPPPNARVAEFRVKLRDGLWEEAESLAREHARSGADDADALLLEFKAARDARSNALRAELQAAQEVQDAYRVIDLRDELLTHLPEHEHAGLNRDLASWLLHLVQRRCLTGKVAADVVDLAERVSQVFSTTREGASLRASLPTLRRCAGLCPRCSQPYNGEESACPRCLAAALPTPAWPADEEGEEDSPAAESPAPGNSPNGHPSTPRPPGNA